MMTDEQLIEGCLKGNALAQQALFDKYSGKMMGVCLRYASNYEEAQDVLQDGFVKVFMSLNKFQRKGSFEGWIRRTIVNTALDNYRKMKNQRQNADIDSLEFAIPQSGMALENIAAQDLLELIRNLPSGYRTVFNMFAIEGYSHKEIAAELKITESTSKSQYRKAKAYLQKYIPTREPVRS